MNVRYRCLKVREDELDLLSPFSLFTVKRVRRYSFLITHGKHHFLIKGSIPNLKQGEALTLHNDCLVPSHSGAVVNYE